MDETPARPGKETYTQAPAVAQRSRGASAGAGSGRLPRRGAARRAAHRRPGARHGRGAERPPGAPGRAVRRPRCPRQRPLRRLRPPLRPASRPDRPVRRPPEPRRLALHPGLRPGRGRRSRTRSRRSPSSTSCPGSDAFSLATQGCNFHCAFCQNWHISLAHREDRVPESRFLPPDAVVEEACAAGVRSIAYTYVEPTVFIEYALDTMVRARAAGLHNVFVTNGYESPEALDLVVPYLDAANVDVKAADDQFYRRICGARWEPVRDTVVELRKRGVWLELTTLIIPDLNDDRDALRDDGRMDRHRRRARDALAPDALRAGLQARRTCRPRRPRLWWTPRRSPARSACATSTSATRPRWRRPTRSAPAAASGSSAGRASRVTEWHLVEGPLPALQARSGRGRPGGLAGRRVGGESQGSGSYAYERPAEPWRRSSLFVRLLTAHWARSGGV